MAAASRDDVATNVTNPPNVTAAFDAYVTTLQIPAGSPKAVLAAVGRGLAAAFDERGTLPGVMIRELADVLVELLDQPQDAAGDRIDELRAHRHARRVAAFFPPVEL